MQAMTTSGAARSAALEAAYAMIEREITVLGVSAIEDNLQDAVPETIAALRDANIKVWMLTGDKRGTAIQIAKSCKLFQGGATVEIYFVLSLPMGLL